MNVSPNNIRLRKLARGPCAAISRPADVGVALRWFPIVGKEQFFHDTVPEDGFDTKPEAIAAARLGKQIAQEILAESMGAN